MKTVSVNLYSFNELSTEVKNQLHNEFKDDLYFDIDEQLKSLKAVMNHFNCEVSFGRNGFDAYCASNAYFAIDHGFTYDEIFEFSGVRLWKYFKNNNLLSHYNSTFKKNYDITKGECVFTGFCFDEILLDPFNKFMVRPTNISFQELMRECVQSWLKSIQAEYEYRQSFEYFVEEMEMRHENECFFDVNGSIINF